jgi:hypothetical protein
MAQPRSKENKVVVGVDFGTTFSGVAWAKIGDVSTYIVHLVIGRHFLILTLSRIIRMLYSNGLDIVLRAVRKFPLRYRMTILLQVLYGAIRSRRWLSGINGSSCEYSKRFKYQ